MSDEQNREPPPAPIAPTTFVAGVNVVDIGDVRVARGLTRRPRSACTHKKLVYDMHERRVWCEDCEQTVEPFDAFVILVEHFHAAENSLRRRREALDEAEREKLISLAARQLDKAWRRHNTVPACPCCGLGLFPEDFKNGVVGKLGRDYALQARKRRAEQKRP